MVSPLQEYEQQPLVSLKEAIQPLISVVPGIKQMFDVIEQNVKQSTNHLSVEESTSIILYTLKWKTPQSSFQFILNEVLRSQIREQLLPWLLYIRLFISALSKLPSISFSTVYRTLKIDVQEDYLKGDEFIWWDFVSCTSSIEFPDERLNANDPIVIFIIECGSAKDISQYVLNSNGNEIILYPGKQFQVISCVDYGNQHKLIQLKEIQRHYPSFHIPQIISNRIIPLQNLELIIGQYPYFSKIDLTKYLLTDADMHIIVNYALMNKQCHKLLLSENLITSIGSAILARALTNNTTLKFLSLAYNNLSDDGVQSLAESLALNHSKLETLSLHGTGITDRSVRALADMLKKNTTLTWLHLGRNMISDQYLTLLTEALAHHNETLKVLDLSHNELITDSSVKSIIEMFESNTSLETLWINHCQLSKPGKKRLQDMIQADRRFFLLFV